jgi:hypothetical protein
METFVVYAPTAAAALVALAAAFAGLKVVVRYANQIRRTGDGEFEIDAEVSK